MVVEAMTRSSCPMPARRMSPTILNTFNVSVGTGPESREVPFRPHGHHLSRHGHPGRLHAGPAGGPGTALAPGPALPRDLPRLRGSAVERALRRADLHEHDR